MTEKKEELHRYNHPDRSLRWLFDLAVYAEGLIRIVAPDLAEKLDFSRLTYEKCSFVDESFREKESDLIVRLPYLDAPDVEILVYILVELQSAPDPRMPLRMFQYVSRVIDWQVGNLVEGELLQPIVPILFYHGDQEWKASRDLATLFHGGEVFKRFVPYVETIWFDLKRTDVEDLKRKDHPCAQVFTVLARENASLEDLEEALQSAMAALVRMEPHGGDAWYRALWFMHTTFEYRRSKDEVERLTKYVQSVIQDRQRREEVKHMAETAAEARLKEGMEKGMERGMERGQVMALRGGILRQLRRKFGSVPQEVEMIVSAEEDLTRLEEWHDRIVDANSITEMGITK